MMTETLLTQDEVAAILRIQPSTLATWRRAGRGPVPVQLAYNVIRWRREDVDAWLDARVAA